MTEIENDPLFKLQQWYRAQCDGDWEHDYGIKIDTLDNPGWQLEIELAGTNLDGRTFDMQQIEVTEDDWVHYRVENNKFVAYGGPLNLGEMISHFLTWVGTITPSSQ